MTPNAYQNAYQKYQQQSVTTMTQGEMLIKLFDDTIKQLNAFKQFNDTKDYEMANTASKKAQQIIQYLDSTLNFKYEISNNLNALYEYFIHQLVQANLHKDNAIVDEVLSMVCDLRETFIQADKNARGS